MNKLILVIGLALAYKAYQAFKTVDEETDNVNGKEEPKEVFTSKEVGEKIVEAIENIKTETEKQKNEIQTRLNTLQKELGILHDLEVKNEQLSTLGGIVVAEITYNGLPIKEARKVREEELNYLFKILKELEQNKEQKERKILNDEEDLLNIFLNKNKRQGKTQIYTLEDFVEKFSKQKNI